VHHQFGFYCWKDGSVFKIIIAMKHKILYVFLFCSFLIGCDSDSNKEGVDATEEVGETRRSSSKSLPSSTGAKAEVIVVCPDSIWEGAAGGTMRSMLSGMQYGTRNESWFDLFHIRERDFKEMLKRTRHLIHIYPGNTNQTQLVRDMYASPQEYISIQYTNKAALDSMIAPAMKQAFLRFRQLDMDIVKKKWKNKVWPVPKAMRQNGIDFLLPKSFQTTVEEKNLVVAWASSSRADLVMFVSVRPFTLEQQMTFRQEHVIAWRDSISKLHIQADAPGSYTQTESDPAPERRLTKLGPHIAIETRGYFRSVGDFMGGSFINYVVIDEDRERMIMLDGLVYAPNEKKRNVLMELEAMFESLKLQ
jgi:hypothetical protein